jgi:hypothetical protein
VHLLVSSEIGTRQHSFRRVSYILAHITLLQPSLEAYERNCCNLYVEAHFREETGMHTLLSSDPAGRGTIPHNVNERNDAFEATIAILGRVLPFLHMIDDTILRILR